VQRVADVRQNLSTLTVRFEVFHNKPIFSQHPLAVGVLRISLSVIHKLSGSTCLVSNRTAVAFETYSFVAIDDSNMVQQPYGTRTLTKREHQVIALVAEGLKNREVALELGTTEPVIKNYLRRIYDKLGVWSRVELALWYEARQHEKFTAQAEPQNHAVSVAAAAGAGESSPSSAVSGLKPTRSTLISSLSKSSRALPGESNLPKVRTGTSI
jgi:DNA-binding CsgD family transcriptional regulator